MAYDKAKELKFGLEKATFAGFGVKLVAFKALKNLL